MKSARETFLSKLDNSLRWTGIPARVAEDMSAAPSVDRKYRPLRWMPLWPIAFSCALFVLALTWSSTPQLARLSAIIVGVQVSLLAVALGFYMNGPLGKPALEDDEREAALRKSSLLFCLGLLAWLNCVGQPMLMILSHLQHWSTGHSVSVAAAAVMLNATLFGCLPTLYASWKLPPLP